jgi:hypothetical protein
MEGSQMSEDKHESTRLRIYTLCSGDKLWVRDTNCPHTSNNACSACDFDKYYLNKHRGHCPWEVDVK